MCFGEQSDEVYSGGSKQKVTDDERSTVVYPQILHHYIKVACVSVRQCFMFLCCSLHCAIYYKK